MALNAVGTAWCVCVGLQEKQCGPQRTETRVCQLPRATRLGKVEVQTNSDTPRFLLPLAQVILLGYDPKV